MADHDEFYAQVREQFPNAEIIEPENADGLIEVPWLSHDAPPPDGARLASLRSGDRADAGGAERPRLDVWTHTRPTGPHIEFTMLDFGHGRTETTIIKWTDHRPRKPGKKRTAEKRTARTEMSEADRERSGDRAKQSVRRLCKSMAADRLLTLTSRKYLYDPDLCWPVLQRFRHLLNRRGIRFQYVCVPELHKSGEHWHMHLALNKYVPVEPLRYCWREALRQVIPDAQCDHSPGNVDISKKTYPGRDRVTGISKYISKYITKQFSDGWMHSRRYSSSRDIAPPRRVKLYTCISLSDLWLIREAQRLSGAELTRNPQWISRPMGDVLWVETEPAPPE